ncbi:MAG: helix-turn-helix domain-containing protein [Lachnospiraceae bacterium]
MKYNRIRNIREDNELTQEQVAKFLNIAQRTYSGYENGTRNIPVQCIIKLAKYYKTSTDYLLELTDEKRPYKSKT